MNQSSKLFLTNILLFCLTGAAFSCSNTSPNSSEVKEVGLSTVAVGENLNTENSPSVTYTQGEWPAFHGIDRTNKSRETGLLKTWPQGGPQLLNTISGLGEGYSSVSIADSLIFTSGTSNNQTYVFAFDLSGKLIWKKPNGEAWKVEVSWAKGYDGPRSTPTYDNGIVYHLSELNKLTAYKARTGEVVWTRDLMADFDSNMPDYGFTESVLIEGEKLFVKPGGKKGFQVCLNKMNGETIWTNNEIPGSYAYNSPVLHNFGGYRQLISASADCYYGVDTETGKLLWKVDFENQYKVNCTDAVVINDHVFMSSGEGGGSMLIKLKASGKDISTETVWKTELMDNYHGGVIYHNGYFYGSGSRNRGWFSIDMKTGQQMWKAPGNLGSLTYADDMLYLCDEKGNMKLVKASPANFEVAGEFKVTPGGKGPFWAHPVVCDGKLYIRHSDKLFVYNIRNN